MSQKKVQYSKVYASKKVNVFEKHHVFIMFLIKSDRHVCDQLH